MFKLKLYLKLVKLFNEYTNNENIIKKRIHIKLVIDR